MTGKAPLVSTIVAVKDREAHLEEALQSILSQDHRPLEIIVVDGASRDRSAEIASSFDEVILLQQEGTGLAGAWNQGIAASTGQLIAFLDSDDRWLPSRLPSQIEMLEREPELVGAIGLVQFILEPGATPPPGTRREWLTGGLPAPMPGTLLVRREIFESIGDFDPAYELSMDVDWFARLKDAGLELGTVPQVVLEKRLGTGNLSLTQPERYKRELLAAMRASAARQSAGGSGR